MMKMTNKQVMTREEWNALRYRVEVQELSPEEGGGWMAWIPQLGQGAFMIEGETAAGALANLEEHRREMYDVVVKDGRPIPLPADVTDQPVASGKWLQRASRKLHAELREAAEKDGVSFNSYCESALLRGHMQLSATEAMERAVEKTCEQVKFRVNAEAINARYKFTGVTGAELPPGAEGLTGKEDWNERQTG